MCIFMQSRESHMITEILLKTEEQVFQQNRTFQMKKWKCFIND